jgi:hydroxymethylbilane synthase
MREITVAARASPLSVSQTFEVLSLIQKTHPEIEFEPHFLKSHGDVDLSTSLRSLDKTDFFTREIDALVLNNTCQIAIHSAKDLPETIPDGLKIVAITRGIDPSDSLVLREYDTLESLNPGSIIATSSLRREEMVRSLRNDLKFRDLRGTIHKRLELLQKGEADGVVIAEAALLRLNLSYLNRVRLPGATTEMQGQLAILAREDDHEMETLFKPLDSREMSKSLYLGPEYPLKAFPDKRITHCPLIETALREPCDALSNWQHFTHVILTSKTAVRALVSLLRRAKISPHTLAGKQVIVVGKATAELANAFGANPLVAEEETAEGVATLIKALPLDKAHFFWPHSSLSRPLIENVLKEKNACLTSCILYDTSPIKDAELPPLSDFQEVLFSSPSTVAAFFACQPSPPAHLQFTPIGRITLEELAKYTLIHQND